MTSPLLETNLSLPVDGADMPAFAVHPQNAEHAPGIILIHEIWGLNDNIRDIAQRFAGQGYSVLAPDLLKGTDIEGKVDPSIFQEMQDPTKRDEAQKKMRAALAPMQSPDFAAALLKKLRVCFAELQKSTEKIAVMGFCFGGSYSFAFAAEEPRITACIPFYGQPPSEEQIKRIQAPVLAFYGEQDQNLMQSLPLLKVQMQKHGKTFENHVYPQTGHAFFNDQNPRMYQKEAAEDAWKKSLAFLATFNR